MDLIRLPRRFLDDHDERMCDDPDVPLVVRVKETARFAWVARNDPGLADLRNDAEYYAASAVPGGLSEGYEWCGRAAKTLLRLLDEAGWVPRDFEEAKEMTTCKTCKQPLTVIGLLGWCDNMACLDYDAHYAAGPRHDKEDQR